MFRSRKTSEALRDAERACMDRGAVILEALHSDDLGVTEYMRLSGEDFQCLRMHIRRHHPSVVLDCVWSTNGTEDEYRVRLDWDIEQIRDIS